MPSPCMHLLFVAPPQLLPSLAPHGFPFNSPADPAPLVTLLPQDHYDVKMPAHLLLATLAATEPATVLGALERVVGALEKTLTAKVKSDAVKQEVRRGGKGVAWHRQAGGVGQGRTQRYSRGAVRF